MACSCRSAAALDICSLSHTMIEPNLNLPNSFLYISSLDSHSFFSHTSFLNASKSPLTLAYSFNYYLQLPSLLSILHNPKYKLVSVTHSQLVYNYTDLFWTNENTTPPLVYISSRRYELFEKKKEYQQQH